MKVIHRCDWDSGCQRASVSDSGRIVPCLLIPHELWESKLGEAVEKFASQWRFGFLVFESFVFEPVTEGAFQSGHAGLDQTATMIAAGLLPASSPQAANALNGFIAGQWSAGTIAVLPDRGPPPRRNHGLNLFPREHVI